MHPYLHTLNLPPLLLLASAQRQAISEAAARNVAAHQQLRNQRQIQSADKRGNTSELADDRKRELCEQEIAEARRMGFI